MLRFFVRIMLVSSLLLFPALTATAVQDEILLAKMKVVREINLGGVYEYEVECEGRGRAILKTSPLRLKAGEAVNLFVQEGAKEGGKPAYVALTGESPRSFKEGFAAVHVGNSWRFIDKNGRMVGQRGFEEVRDFQDGFALVRLKDGLAFLGKDGNLLPTPLISLMFDFSEEHTGFNEGLAIMESRTTDNNRVIIILDKSGSVIKVVDGREIDKACLFTEGLVAVRKVVSHARYGKAEYHLFGYIDKSGKVVIPHEFPQALPFKEGRAAVMIKEYMNETRGKWGFIDKSGKLVIDAKYDFVRDFSEGLAAVKSGDKWGFIDKEGNVRVNLSYDEAFAFSDGLAVVRRGNLYGAIDKNGRVVIKFLYGYMKPFANGLAPVTEKFLGRQYGYLDKTGKLAIAMQFEEAESFSEGLALVRQGMNMGLGMDRVSKYKYINTKGQAALWFYMPKY